MIFTALPDGWHVANLGDIAKVSGGKRLPKGHQLTDDETGHPYIRVADMNETGIDLANILFVPLEVAPAISRYTVRENDLYISVAGTLGLIGKIPPELDGANLTENADRISNIASNVDYLLYVLRSRRITRIIDSIKTTSAQPKLALERIRTIDLPLPPLPEQRKIAEILSTWDRAIEITERLIAAKQRRKKALMQRLLTGKVRFPGFTEPWEEVRLGEVAHPVKRRNKDGATHVLTASGAHGLIDQREYFSKNVSADELSGYYLLRGGEFAYNRSAMKGYPYGAIKRLERYNEGVLSTLYICFQINNPRDNPVFFKWLFESGHLDRSLRKIAQVGSRAHGLLNVTKSDFFGIPVARPPYEEQQRIAELFTAVDTEIEALEQLKAQLQEQKKGLMQQLLTGKTRVKVEV